MKLSGRNDAVVAYLGLGSNMGDAQEHIVRAIAQIGSLPATTVLHVSGLYGSAPWGKADQPDFVNAVVEVATALDGRHLLSAIKEIERAHGRVGTVRWGPRPLDIDILLLGTSRISEHGLEVPHPRMWDRAFVLRPLADLRPDFVGPDGRSIGERLQDEEIVGQNVWLVT